LSSGVDGTLDAGSVVTVTEIETAIFV